MPKKSTSKDSEKKKRSSSKKRGTSKKSSPKIQKKEVKRAVEQLPGLILGHQNISHATFSNPIPKNDNHNDYPSHSSFDDVLRRKKKKWILVGTSALTVLVVAMWFLNIKTFVYSMRNVERDESALWKAAQFDLTSISSDFDALTDPANMPTSDNTLSNDNESALKEALIESLPTIITTSTSTPTNSTTVNLEP